MIDETLIWSAQVNKIAGKVNSGLGISIRLRYIVDYQTFKNSLIIHKEIKQSHQRIGSRAYTFKTGNTLSV